MALCNGSNITFNSNLHLLSLLQLLKEFDVLHEIVILKSFNTQCMEQIRLVTPNE